MNVTELLITGFEGDKAVFAASLTPYSATTIMTATDDGGSTAVESVSERATSAFTSVRQLFEGLTSAA